MRPPAPPLFYALRPSSFHPAGTSSGSSNPHAMQAAIVQALLRHGANPNKAFPCDPHRPMDQVPLVSMDWKPEDAACMVALLQGGLDPRPQTSNGVTILHKAMTMPFAAALQCVRLLVANPLTDVNVSVIGLGTPLHMACLRKKNLQVSYCHSATSTGASGRQRASPK